MKIGVIGGTGLYEMPGLERLAERVVDTPWGPPSDAYLQARLGNCEVFFLPRHGRGHRILPHEINHRANIFGFKLLGVEQIISVSAVGSLQESYRPGDILLPDQYFDRTKASDRHTFFGNGIAAHIAFAEPVCRRLRGLLAAAGRAAVQETPSAGTRIHEGGTYVNIEGPAFSTKAESNVYRKVYGFDVIGMTSLAEAKLCREAEICYACMAMVTDYDCWHETEESVSVEVILGVLRRNADLARAIVQRALETLSDDPACPCRSALRYAIVTDPKLIPSNRREALAPIIGKYVV